MMGVLVEIELCFVVEQKCIVGKVCLWTSVEPGLRW